MPRILQRPRAVEDLIGIWTYIAQHNPAAADRTLDELEGVIRLVAEFPLMARATLSIGFRSVAALMSSASSTALV
jgi:plasmid stabilization system protein ParE